MRRTPRPPLHVSTASAAATTLALLCAHCGGGHPSATNATDASAGRDAPGMDTVDTGVPLEGGSGVDAADATVGADAADAVADSPPEAAPLVNMDVCGVASGVVAWGASIVPSSSTLLLADVAASSTDDAVVADQSGATYEQHRWNNAGSVVNVHQDPLGQYTGPLWPSSLVMDTHDNLFYGILKTGLTQGTNSATELSFTLLPPTGSPVVSPPINAAMPTADGPPKVLLFSAGFDSGGGYHGPLAMGATAYYPAGVYCYGSNLASEATSAQSVTSTLTATDFEWPAQSSSLYVAKSVTGTVNLGCGALSVPASGGVVLASLDSGGSCQWNKLLALPTAAVKAMNFRVGADGTLVFEVVYAGSIDFGGGSLVSAGTSSLAVARFDEGGTLLFARTFGSASSGFTIGSVAINANGILVLTAGYTGSVDLGGGALPASTNTLLASFDATGTFKWNRTVTVDPAGKLVAAIGKCGMVIATNSPSVDLGNGPLSVAEPAMPPSIGVAALGL